jgi:hypothetical protein
MPRFLNVSRALCWLECPRKYHYVYERNMKTKGGEANQGALSFGTAIHDGLAAWYLSGGDDAKALAALEASFGPDVRLDDLKPNETPAYGAKMLAGYFGLLRSDFDEDRFKVLTAEVELTAHVDDGAPILVCRPDLIVEDKDGLLWHVQHKTVGHTVDIEQYVRKYDLAWHERAYRLAIEAAYPGRRVAGTVLNVLRKTKVPSYGRFRVAVTDEMVEEFRQGFRRVGDEIAVKSGTLAYARPQNGRACWEYARMCPYWALCLGVDPGWEDAWDKREPDYVDAQEEGKGK